MEEVTIHLELIIINQVITQLSNITNLSKVVKFIQFFIITLQQLHFIPWIQNSNNSHYIMNHNPIFIKCDHHLFCHFMNEFISRSKPIFDCQVDLTNLWKVHVSCWLFSSRKYFRYSIKHFQPPTHILGKLSLWRTW